MVVATVHKGPSSRPFCVNVLFLIFFGSDLSGVLRFCSPSFLVLYEDFRHFNFTETVLPLELTGDFLTGAYSRFHDSAWHLSHDLRSVSYSSCVPFFPVHA